MTSTQRRRHPCQRSCGIGARTPNWATIKPPRRYDKAEEERLKGFDGVMQGYPDILIQIILELLTNFYCFTRFALSR